MRRRPPPLAEYKRKRHFGVTPEPAGRISRIKGVHPFVIQKHAATRLHFDFRLELDGTLKSWAVPKGPSLNPADKRLAVQVEDHPVEYATFEGNIPQGEYGGGSVIVWDRGTWNPEQDDPAEALRKGKISFTLHGERLKGRWTLFRLSGQESERQPSWMLKKHADEHADDDGDRLVRDELTSIESGRSLEQVATSNGATWSSGRTRKGQRKTPVEAATSGIDLGAVPEARKISMPDTYRPQLATLVEQVPAGGGWIHEVKYDGYRILAHRANGQVQLITRGQLDWAASFPRLVDAVA